MLAEQKDRFDAELREVKEQLRAELQQKEGLRAELQQKEALRAELQQKEGLRAEKERLRAELQQKEGLRAKLQQKEGLRVELQQEDLKTELQQEDLKAELQQKEGLRAELQQKEGLRQKVGLRAELQQKVGLRAELQQKEGLRGGLQQEGLSCSSQLPNPAQMVRKSSFSREDEDCPKPNLTLMENSQLLESFEDPVKEERIEIHIDMTPQSKKRGGRRKRKASQDEESTPVPVDPVSKVCPAVRAGCGIISISFPTPTMKGVSCEKAKSMSSQTATHNCIGKVL